MTAKNYKLIAFDIDGTILDGSNRVCQRLINVVAKLRERGYLFTLVSARVPLSVLEIAKELGIPDSYVVALNGSLITNRAHEVLYSRSFATKRVQDLLAKVDKRISRNYYNHFDWIVEYANDYTLFEISLLEQITAPVAKAIPEEVNKITLIGDHDLLVEAKQVFRDEESLLLGFSHHNYVEITCNTISKFQGIKNYAAHFGISVDEIIAFGDGENDMPILSQVGLGVAMGNAKEHVKGIAKDIAGNHYDQGVAIYLEELFGIS